MDPDNERTGLSVGPVDIELEAVCSDRGILDVSLHLKRDRCRNLQDAAERDQTLEFGGHDAEYYLADQIQPSSWWNRHSNTGVFLLVLFTRLRLHRTIR